MPARSKSALGVCAVLLFWMACLPCARAQSVVGKLVGLLPAVEVEDEEPRARTGVRFIAPASFSKFVTLRHRLAARQEITLSAELERVAPPSAKSLEGVNREPEWKFKAIPVTLGYAYHLPSFGRITTPEVGLGVSAYFAKTSLRDYARVDAGLAARPDYERGLGVGYGAQATLGLRTMLGRDLFVLAQGRFRYVNGFGVTGGTAAFRNEFAKFDFSLGMGVRL